MSVCISASMSDMSFSSLSSTYRSSEHLLYTFLPDRERCFARICRASRRWPHPAIYVHGNQEVHDLIWGGAFCFLYIRSPTLDLKLLFMSRIYTLRTGEKAPHLHTPVSAPEIRKIDFIAKEGISYMIYYMLKLTSKNSFLSKQIILLLVNQTSLLELYLHEPSCLSFGWSVGLRPAL